MSHPKIFPASFLFTIAIACVIATTRPTPSLAAAPAFIEEATSFTSAAADSLPGVRFVHIATPASIEDQSTFIDHPALNLNPNAIFLVTHNWDVGIGSSPGIYNDHPIGVYYNAFYGKWAVFNEDIANMPTGAAFNVFIPNAGAHVFVHTATVSNITSNWTAIDHPLLNNNPNAIVLVTQNWNPGGTGGTYNNHHIGVWYNTILQKWAVFNQDSAPMPVDASFNVVVTGPAVAFVHKATTQNLSNHTTFISHPKINNNPNAIVVVTPNWNPGGTGGTYNNHSIGVYYLPAIGRWGIFNQDLAFIPVNASFNVLIPDTRTDVFRHTATPGNTAGASNQYTFIDHPLLNNNPNAIAFVTQNWNPDGATSGTYNDRPVGVFYNGSLQKWTIFNQSVTAMPAGADFNVFVPPPGANVFVHTATSANITSNWTVIDHPLLNNKPDAKVLVTQNWNPGGVGGTYNNHPIGVFYSGSLQKWAIFNQDNAPMPVDADFNVMVLNDLAVLPWSKDAFVHTATTANITGNWTALNHPLTNGRLPAYVFVTDNYNPGGGTGTYNNHNTGVWYTGTRWAIFNQDEAAMPINASFNVLVIVRSTFIPVAVRQ